MAGAPVGPTGGDGVGPAVGVGVDGEGVVAFEGGMVTLTDGVVTFIGGTGGALVGPFVTGTSGSTSGNVNEEHITSKSEQPPAVPLTGINLQPALVCSFVGFGADGQADASASEPFLSVPKS